MKTKFTLLASLLLIASISFAQLMPREMGLNFPTDPLYMDNGDIWLTVGGTGQDDAMVIILHPDGKKDTAITGLPSFFDPAVMELITAWRIVKSQTSEMAVVVGGSKQLGPHFGSLLLFDFAGFVPGKDAPKTVNDTSRTFDISSFSEVNTDTKESNPFSAVQDAHGDWYVTDAAANMIVRVTKLGKSKSVFARFENVSNPTPVGPPSIHAVPTGIALNGKEGFLVTTLTGFPFVDGLAGVYKVSYSGTVTPLKKGLTLLTDIQVVNNNIYLNQFGTFNLILGAFGSGSILKLNKDNSVESLFTGYGPAQGFGINNNGKVAVSSSFAGILFTGELPKPATVQPPLETRSIEPIVKVFPNPATNFIQVEFNELSVGKTHLYLIDQSGKTIQSTIRIPNSSITSLNVSHLSSGVYTLKIVNDKNQLVQKVQINK